MQVSSSDYSERTILFTVSIFAIVQISEECVLRTVVAEKSKACQTPQPCVGKIVLLLMLLCYGFQESRRCRNHVAFHCLASVAIYINDMTFLRQSSSYRSPVLKKRHTCRCQPVTTVMEPFSSQFEFFFVRSQMNEECLLGNVEI